MDKKRIPLWDNLRFLLIVCVVVGHFIDQINCGPYRSLFFFITIFHMPLFIFVSGLFHSNRNIFPKMLSYFAIYILLKIAIYSVRKAFGTNVDFLVFEEMGVPWFMFALAVFLGLTYLLRNINLKFILFFNLLLALFSGFDKNVADFLVMSRLIVYYPFYLVGVMVSRQDLEKLHEKRIVRAASCVVLMICAVVCLFFCDKIYFLRHMFTGRNPFADSVVQHGELYRLLCYTVTFIVGFSVIMVTPACSLGPVTTWGSRTLQVYFWHQPLLYVLLGFDLHTLICATSPGKIAWILVAVAITVILSFRIFRFPTSQILAAPYKTDNS